MVVGKGYDSTDIQYNEASTQDRKFCEKFVMAETSWCYHWIASPLAAHQEMGKNLGYLVILEEDEDGGLVATIPSLPGCITEGDTEGEALAYLADAIAGWMKVSLDKNLAIPDPDNM